MKCLSCSSSKSCNKLTVPNAKASSLINSFWDMRLNDIELNSKKLKNKFYYKNPEFLNESNIKKQINILLTNVTNKNSNNKLPKIILDDDNKSYDIKKKYYLNTNNNQIKCINELPNIKLARKSTYFINKDNSKTKNITTKNKSVDFDYKSIFPNYNLFKEKKKPIDNKLNLLYCQNESQYRLLIAKRKQLKGMDMIKEQDSDKIKHRVNTIKTKIKFMKNVIDYSYPDFMLYKIKIWKKNLEEIKGEEKLLPQEEQKNQIKNKNIEMTNYMKKNFKVYPLKFEK